MGVGEASQPMPPIQALEGAPTRLAVDRSHSIVSVGRGEQNAGFARRVGEEIKLAVTTAGGQKLSQAHLGQFVVRLPDGSQRKVERGTSGDPSYTLNQPGAAMFITSVGDSPDGVARDTIEGITQYSKVIVSVDAPARELPQFIDAGLTDKTGQWLELRPMVNPIGLAPRAMLPIKLYAFGKSQPHQMIDAVGPRGQVITEYTNHAGLAHFYLPESGDWTFRWAAHHKSRDYAVELAFSTRALGGAR